MGALIALLPTILQLMNNPDVQKLIPLLAQLGSQVFPGVDPNKAQSAGAALFDTNSIKWVQTALNIWDPSLKLDVDGISGAATIAAVKKYQETHNLVSDGWSG